MFDPFKKLVGIETQTEKKAREAGEARDRQDRLEREIRERREREERKRAIKAGVNPDSVVTLLGHGGWVNTLILLSDGRLASGSRDNTIKLWNVKSGESERTLLGHSGGINVLTLLSDGRLASGGGDNTIKLWNVSSGACERTLSGHSGGVNVLILLSDGRLASGSHDKAIKLWSVSSGACERTLSGHSGSVNALTLLSDGRLASGCGFLDKTIKLWNVSSGECERTLLGHSFGVYTLTLLSDGRLASGCEDGKIRLWNVLSGELESTLSGHSHDVRALTLLSDGRLASGSYDNTIKLWNVQNGECECTLSGHSGLVCTLTLLSDGRLASGSNDATVKLWNVGLTLEQLAQDEINLLVDKNEFIVLQQELTNFKTQKTVPLENLAQELAVLQERMASIPTQTLDLSDNEKMVLQQRLVKDQSEEQRLQERYTIESDLPRRQYYYLIQTHVSELMVASLGIGSGYIDVNHSQSATVVGWICDGLSSAFPGVSILTTIVNAGVNCLDIKYRKFLLEKVRLFGHTINEAEVLGEELARLFVRAHYHAKTIFSEAQADKDAAALIKVIVKAQSVFERNEKTAEQLVRAVFGNNNLCLNALPNTYVAPTKTIVLPTPVSINLVQPAVIVPPSTPSTFSISINSPAPSLTIEDLMRRLEEQQLEMNSLKTQLQNAANKSDVDCLQQKVSKLSPKENLEQGGGLILKNRADEMEADRLKASHIRVEQRMGYVEDHVGVVSEETQRLREQVAVLERRLGIETSSVSQMGMYAGNARQQQSQPISDSLKSQLFGSK